MWRPAQDVLAQSGDAANGLVDEVHVSAGLCPTYAAGVWDASSTETLLAIWGGSNPNQVNVVRVGSPGATGVYSPLRNVPSGSTGGSTGRFTLHSVVVSARPFGDDAMPFP
jgi:hypothetical protein